MVGEPGFEPALHARDEWGLKEIRAHDPGANVVMCTAMGQKNMVVEAIQAGARDFIVKPFQPDRVLEAMGKAAA